MRWMYIICTLLYVTCGWMFYQLELRVLLENSYAYLWCVFVVRASVCPWTSDHSLHRGMGSAVEANTAEVR